MDYVQIYVCEPSIWTKIEKLRSSTVILDHPNGQSFKFTLVQPNFGRPNYAIGPTSLYDNEVSPLFGDHRLGQEAGDSEVPARGHKLLETAQTAGLNQDCYKSEYLIKSLGKKN